MLNNFEDLQNSDMLEIKHNPEHNILYNKWNVSIIIINDLRKEMELWQKQYYKTKTSKLITDNRVNQIITADTKSWLTNFLIATFKNSKLKWAVIIDENIPNQILGVEEMFAEFPSQIKWNFFHTIDQSVIDWLNE